jgi:hypothetical protein
MKQREGLDREERIEGDTFEITSAVSAKVEHLCNPVLARKSSINLVPILYPLLVSFLQMYIFLLDLYSSLEP